MKRKIAILTDSSSSIYNVKHGFDNLFMIDIPCFIGDVMFKDFEKNTDAVFYDALKKTTLVPKTSQPSVGETVAKYEEIKSLGYTDIIYIPISKELSGTYQNGYTSREMVEGINIELIDSLTAVSMLGGMAFEAAKLAKQGKSIEEIKARVLELRSKCGYFVTVNNLTALVKNGRLSMTKSKIANLLKIKPVIVLNDAGKLEALENVRTYKASIKRVVDYCLEKLDKDHGEIHIAYMENNKDYEFARDYILEKFPNTNIKVYSIPATVVAHIGLEAIGVGYLNY
jgi:DegV family protein with EDD domain